MNTAAVTASVWADLNSAYVTRGRKNVLKNRHYPLHAVDTFTGKQIPTTRFASFSSVVSIVFFFPYGQYTGTGIQGRNQEVEDGYTSPGVQF
jgi:hypothetical protein